MDTYRDDGKCVLCKQVKAMTFTKHPGSEYPIQVCERCVEQRRGQKKKRFGENERAHQRGRKLLVYFIGERGSEFVKIGQTHCEKCLQKRLSSIQTGNPRELKVLACLLGGVENEVHRKFESSRVGGEWFKETPEMKEYMATIKAKSFNGDTI